MDNQKLSTIFNAAKTKVVKNGPAILTAMGIVGWGTATVLAVKETPKALKLIANAEHDKGEPLTTPEKVKAAWKPYLPAALIATASTGCLIGACKVSAGRTAALATAYQLSTTALKDYKEQVVETVGEKKEQSIREKVHKKKIEENPVSNAQVYYTGKGKTKCYDVTSGRYFETDKTSIEKIINKLNQRMLGGEMYISLNEFYTEVGLPPIPIGDNIGWNTDAIIEPHFSSQLDDYDNPVLVLDYLVAPRWNFSDLM
jgi:hypothetical protein